jgi:hypothetical protein
MAALALAFVTAHIIVAVTAGHTEADAASDVWLYDHWMTNAFDFNSWPIRDFTWVYPALALLPMSLAKGLATLTGMSFLVAWTLLVTLVDVATAAALVWRFGVRRTVPALVFWAVFIVALGVPGLMRLDPLIPPIVIAALLIQRRHTTWAAALLTVGAWIKVAPGVVMLPLLAAAPERWRRIVAGGAAVCAVVAAAAFVSGVSLSELFGFVTSQSGRGTQVESVVATPVVVERALSGETISDYDDVLGTWQLAGGAHGLARAADILLPLTLLAVAALVFRARHSRRAALLVGSLAALSAAIVANKVGSPQFVKWLVGPVVVGLVYRPQSNYWRTMAALVGILAALAHLVYPVAYWSLLDGDQGMVAVEVTRSLTTLAVLVISALKLWRLGGSSGGRGEGEPVAEIVADSHTTVVGSARG